MFLLFLLLCFSGSLLSVEGREFCSRFCYPGNDCFPSAEEITLFAKSLEGAIVIPFNENYGNITLMKNIRVTRFPTIVVMVKSVADVQKSILFARQYTLRVTILSSGHDYIGRSTADGSLLINLQGMMRIHVNLQSARHVDGEVTLESGNTWARVYEEIDKYGRIMVGGSAHTVAIGGYTLGGGHSPMSRMLGLAVDNLLEVQMVTADGSMVNCSASGTTTLHVDGRIEKSANTDLFWALRGGGGGTFGVVTHFTFKLHRPPQGFVHFLCIYSINIHSQTDRVNAIMNNYFSQVKNLPNEWGGYYLLGLPAERTPDYASIILSMLHYGDWNQPSRQKIDPIINFHPKWQYACSLKNVTTFWEYEKTVSDAIYIRTDIANALLRSGDLTNPIVNILKDLVVHPANHSRGGCTGVLIGGATSTPSQDSTAVSPNLRSALSSLSCGLSYGQDPSYDDLLIHDTLILGTKLHAHGHGVYLNEPDDNLPDWKNSFWGPHYQRLLQIKKTWDPDNFFTCRYCVGWDLGGQYYNGVNPVGR